MTETPSQARRVALLPLRDIIVFPHMVVPLFVGRERSIAALDAAMANGREILLAAQREPEIGDPAPEDIFEVGTLARLIQVLNLPDGTRKVLVEGDRRVRILRHVAEEGYAAADVVPLAEEGAGSVEVEALARSLKTGFEAYIKLDRRIPPEMIVSIQSIDDASRLADTVAAHLSLKLDQKQEILAEESVKARLQLLYELLQAETEILQVEKRIRSRVKRQMERSQKEYYLNEQMQAIQKELGEQDEFRGELQELEAQIADTPLSEEAREKLGRELRKLRMMPPMSPEATVVRNYVDWVLALPWEKKEADPKTMAEAEAILEEDHYGLEKIKERILEYLAVHSLVDRMRGPILCFVGPPGVGKTSLGRSIARATGRAFVRASLGGVRDEAEIRGHRRTYIGALPGKVIQKLRKAGSRSPVFLLDEVDKMSTDFRGDPSSALLEVLDPEQNSAFNDHYLDLDYDLSDVMFITTANSLEGIPVPLRDRMEVIRVPGYTDEEKLQIARRYLIPKQIEANGLSADQVQISDNALREIIAHYTKEAGVRSLDREIAAVCRKIARKVVSGGDGAGPYRVTAGSIASYLGVPRYLDSPREQQEMVGLTNGLAVTAYGGDLLPAEVTVMPGKGKLVLTGKLGDVMQESAQAALSYIRSRAVSLGLDPHFNQKVDVHVHCPEGAIPKDGPSAGITIATALVSALLHLPVRADLAMTGEITLRGRVLAIGGLKEKILAAHRFGVRQVVIPKANEKDLREVPPAILKVVEVVPVAHMDEVLRLALLPREGAFLPEPSDIVDWRLAGSAQAPATH